MPANVLLESKKALETSLLDQTVLPTRPKAHNFVSVCFWIPVEQGKLSCKILQESGKIPSKTMQRRFKSSWKIVAR